VNSGRLHHGFLHGRVVMQFPDNVRFEGMAQENQVCAVIQLGHHFCLRAPAL
jgi:hypothetical protein